MLSGQSDTGTWPKAIRNGNLVNRNMKSRFYHCYYWEHLGAYFSMQFVLIFRWFVRFWHAELEPSNIGNDKNERVLMHFRRWSDGVRFWPLQNRMPYYFVFILRWFYMNFGDNFGVILHDFGHPSRSLFKVYEWSSGHVEMRYVHHFFIISAKKAPAEKQSVSLTLHFPARIFEKSHVFELGFYR